MGVATTKGTGTPGVGSDSLCSCPPLSLPASFHTRLGGDARGPARGSGGHGPYFATIFPHMRAWALGSPARLCNIASTSAAVRWGS